MLKSLSIPIKKHCTAEEFEKEIPKFLSKTRRFVYWTTSLYPEFYNKEKVRCAIIDTVDRGIEVKMILDPIADFKKVEWIKKLYKEGKIKVRMATTPNPHVIIGDGFNLRSEPLHKPDTPGGENIIVYNSVIAKDQEIEFLRLWNDKEKTEEPPSDKE
jgi:hypothetical protein